MTRLGAWIRDLPNRTSWRCRLGLHAWPRGYFEFVEVCTRCGWDR